MDAVLRANEDVPEAILSSILRDKLRDPNAQVLSCDIAPFPNSGVSGNNSLYRARVEWAAPGARLPSGSASWLIKCWRPGGISLSELGWNLPLEALAWQHGILRPEMLPAGVKTPIVGAVIDPRGAAAWVAMTDVSQELGEYDRAAPLPPNRLVSNAKAILAGLARFHAFWEQPARQAILEELDWLLPVENYLWRLATPPPNALKKDMRRASGSSYSIRVENNPDLEAFLACLGPAERAIWRELMINRSRLVDGFAGLPVTLLHGDLDDRNIGLGCSAAGECELILVDWEWIGKGPAALDVAKVLFPISIMADPTGPFPEACWSGELRDFYYRRYREAGGKQLDEDTWRHSFDLGLIAQAITPYCEIIGNIIRSQAGEGPLPSAPGLSEEGMRLLLTSMRERIMIGIDQLSQAIQRCFRN